MRPFTWLLILCGFLLIEASCTAQPPPSPLRTTTSIRDIMHTMVEPSANLIWNAVAVNVTLAGTEIRAPETDEEWDAVRNGAISLREATNLILMEGRTVAYPGQRSANPETELEPEQILALIDGDREAWAENVHGLYDAVEVVLKAIEAKDADQLSEAGAGLDTVCENCHLKYWYPEGQ